MKAHKFENVYIENSRQMWRLNRRTNIKSQRILSREKERDNDTPRPMTTRDSRKQSDSWNMEIKDDAFYDFPLRPRPFSATASWRFIKGNEP